MKLAKRGRIRSLVEGYLNWTNHGSKNPVEPSPPTQLMEPLEPRVLLSAVGPEPMDPLSVICEMQFDLNTAEDTNREFLINRVTQPGDTDTVIDVGDSLAGVLSFGQLNGAAQDLGNTINHWDVIFQALVVGKTAIAFDADGNPTEYSFDFAPDPTFAINGTRIGNGIMGVFFEDAPGTTNLGDANDNGQVPLSIQEVIDTIDDGTRFWSVGMTGVGVTNAALDGVADWNGDGMIDGDDDGFLFISPAANEGWNAFTTAGGILAGGTADDIAFITPLGPSPTVINFDSGLSRIQNGAIAETGDSILLTPTLSTFGFADISFEGTAGGTRGLIAQTSDNPLQLGGTNFDVTSQTTMTFRVESFDAAMLGDFVWDDKNANGIQDGPDLDRGINGVTVKLLADVDGIDQGGDGDLIDDIVTTTLTANNTFDDPASPLFDKPGYYKFNGLMPGVEYKVMFTFPEDGGVPDVFDADTNPDGYMVSPFRNAGLADQIDSDANPDDNLMSDIVVLGSGEFNRTLDAGFFRKGSIHAFGFLDENGNGIQDGDEGAFPDIFTDADGNPFGKTFQLFYDVDNNGFQDTDHIDTQTTLNGMAWFEHLTPGLYAIQESPIPEGYALTTNPNFREFTVMSGVELVYEPDAAMLPTDDNRVEMIPLDGAGNEDGDLLRWGNTQLAMLGDYVWDDKNANGIQDGPDSDRGINGVEVKLLVDTDDDGTPDFVVATTTTGANPDNGKAGWYKFDGLTPGEEYQVMFTFPEDGGVPDVFDADTNPDGYMVSPFRNAGLADQIDSDANPDENLMSDIVVLSSGEFNRTLDAGFFRKGSIHAFGFLDENGNGIQDGDEGAFPDIFTDADGNPFGKTFQLFYDVDNNGFQDTDHIDTQTTLNGMAWFEHLTPGLYAIQESPIPEGYALTTNPNFREFTVMSGIELVYEPGAAMLLDGDNRVEMIPLDEDGNEDGDLLKWGNTQIGSSIDLEKFVKIVRQGEPGNEGLTPGFWKTHSRYGPAPLKGWPETGFDPDDNYEAIFIGADVPGDPTLLEALNTGGGRINALLRHSTAALLNAANPNIEYNLDVDEVIAATVAAINSGDATQIEDLKDQFDTWNNQGADLSDGGSGGGGEMIMFGPDDADEAPGLEAQIGDQVMYLYTVENPGEVALNIDSLTDDNGTPLDLTDDLSIANGLITFDHEILGNGDNIFDPDEIWAFQTDFSTITETGTVCNLAVVTATPVGGGAQITDEDPACYHVPDAPPPPPENDDQGLTPGFWKQPQHFEFWTGYNTMDSFNAVFGVTSSYGDDWTLLDALNTGGGGENALARHATAALLNAASEGVNYLYTEAEVIAIVQDAYLTGDFKTAKNLLEAQNELGGIELEDIEIV